jgi:hypothetical protein
MARQGENSGGTKRERLTLEGNAQPASTQALAAFSRDVDELLGMVSFLGRLVAHADDAAVAAAKALLALAKDDDERRRHERTIEQGGAGAQRMMQEQYAEIVTRLAFQRLVDNFLSYISDLLRLVFAHRPEALRSSETVRLDVILRQESMEELVKFLVDRRVERLAYLNLADLATDVERTLGFRLFERKKDLDMAVRLVAIRNLIAHNRSHVNDRFLRQAPDFWKWKRGVYLSGGEHASPKDTNPHADDVEFERWAGQVWLAHGDVTRAATFLAGFVRRLDARAITHFKLAGKLEPETT